MSDSAVLFLSVHDFSRSSEASRLAMTVKRFAPYIQRAQSEMIRAVYMYEKFPYANLEIERHLLAILLYF